LKPVNKYESCN